MGTRNQNLSWEIKKPREPMLHGKRSRPWMHLTTCTSPSVIVQRERGQMTEHMLRAPVYIGTPGNAGDL